MSLKISAQSPSNVLPGLALAAAGVAVAYLVAAPFSVLSPMVVAIVLGVVVGNAVRLPAAVDPGLAVAAKRVLRIGIVLLGLRLSLRDVADLGAGMILTVIAVVVGGIVAGVAIGSALGIDRCLRLLIACGFSICGAAAVAALAGVLGANDESGEGRSSQSNGNAEDDGNGSGAGLRESVVTAVALVVIFGTLMIPLLPALGHLFGLDDMTIGMWAGASVHEVAQVVAIGGAIGGPALGAAVIIKLGRVLMLAPVMAVIAIGERRRILAAGSGSAGGPGAKGDASGDVGEMTLPPIMPLFVAGFLAMVVVRSTGIVPQGVIDVAGVAEQLLLGAAMFALGVGVKFSLIRKVGAAPFAMAALVTVVVAGIGLAGVLIAG
ncbi:putative sulfate exporter family transporter [Corynebacterium freneyi]|uniref:YeiH family protein n=1 Tax=Corynebacterium freneyi TaxID=134034 RepID=UPI00254E72E7|nr:putative sulfate exporter family transporter [Corynebacterium freneyi]MDK8768502.1 putative sulfate exporter family transporter [Corynebacterium freneyi]